MLNHFQQNLLQTMLIKKHDTYNCYIKIYVKDRKFHKEILEKNEFHISFFHHRITSH